MTTAEQLSQTNIGIPGLCPAREDFLRAVVEKSSDYLFVGENLTHTESNAFFTLEIDERNSDLAKAFSISGRPWIQDEIVEAGSR